MTLFMNNRTLRVTVTLIAVRLVVPFASAEPKTYDTVFYKGRAAGLRIVFEFDHGHVEASNVKITESASGKTTKFYLTGRDGQTGTGKIRFAPVKGTRKEVLLEMDPFADAESSIKGSYTAAGKTVPFTLTKRKKHSTAQLPLKVLETPSAFRPHAPRNAFRCPDVRPLSRSFAQTDESLRRSPRSNRLSLDCLRWFPNTSMPAMSNDCSKPFAVRICSIQVARSPSAGPQ